MNKLRGFALAAAVCAALPATARAQFQTWDFAQLAGFNGVIATDPPSYTFSMLGFGSVTVFTTDGSENYFGITSKGFGLTYPNGEKGLGVCKGKGSPEEPTGPCLPNPSEIGNGNTRSLFLDLTGLTNVAGYSFLLSSVQDRETWEYWTSTSTTTTGCGTLSSPTSGTGNNGTSPYVSELISPSVKCIKFSQPSTNRNGDFLLESLTTQGAGFPQEVVPEPATMTLLATGLVGLAGAARRRRKTA